MRQCYCVCQWFTFSELWFQLCVHLPLTAPSPRNRVLFEMFAAALVFWRQTVCCPHGFGVQFLKAGTKPSYSGSIQMDCYQVEQDEVVWGFSSSLVTPPSLTTHTQTQQSILKSPHDRCSEFHNHSSFLSIMLYRATITSFLEANSPHLQTVNTHFLLKHTEQPLWFVFLVFARRTCTRAFLAVMVFHCIFRK